MSAKFPFVKVHSNYSRANFFKLKTMKSTAEICRAAGGAKPPKSASDILADVMVQLDYMEKRGSGLKSICNETKALDGYKKEQRPVFKSTTSQFITTIYSMEYKPKYNEVQS